MAQRFATIDQLSEGRTVLGIGAGESMNLDSFGIEMGKPVKKMKETIKIMKRLWRAKKGVREGTMDEGEFEDLMRGRKEMESREILAGCWNYERIDFDGDFYTLNDSFLQVEPEGDTVPIFIAANGPRTRFLTGKFGEGWIPMSESPALYRKHTEDLKEGLGEAGRNSGEVEKCLWTFTSVSENEDKAVENIRPFAGLFATPNKVREAGYEPPEEEVDYFDIAASEEANRKMVKYGNNLAEEVIKEFSLTGTDDQVTEKLDEYEKAGVDHLILEVTGPNYIEALEPYIESSPLWKLRMGIKNLFK